MHPNPTSINAGSESESVVRWGAIVAGSVVALGALVTLYAFGLGCGFASVDADVSGRLRAVGIFAGVFGAAVPLVALLIGGAVASRAARAATLAAGALHGLVLWGVVALSLVWGVGSLVGNVVGGAASVAREVAQLGGAAVAQGAAGLSKAGAAAAEALPDVAREAKARFGDSVDLDLDDVLKPLNAKRLTAGHPPITEEQLKAAATAIVREALVGGNLDRERATAIVIDKTAISREEADSVVAAADDKVAAARKALDERTAAVKQRVGELRDQAQDKLQEAANVASDGAAKAFWGIFAALAVGLLAAVGGAMAAVGLRRS